MGALMQQKTRIKNYTVRSPTLQTVFMVEEFIRKHNSEFKKTELFEKLPRKVMWSTFQVIIKYLKETYRIIIEKDGIVTYIWNPKFYEKIKNRPEIKL